MKEVSKKLERFASIIIYPGPYGFVFMFLHSLSLHRDNLAISAMNPTSTESLNETNSYLVSTAMATVVAVLTVIHPKSLNRPHSGL